MTLVVVTSCLQLNFLCSKATIIGIQNDRNAMGETSQTISQRRLFYSSTKRASIFEAGITMTPSEQQESMQSMYHVMGPSDNTH
jgi:hypothetical protein